jgi:methyl-accepting chemotaxis protein
MKLHWKLSLVLVIGVLVVVSLTQALQYFTVTKRISNLSSGDLALMRQREETAARNVCDAVGHSVASSLERGEMEKFTRILQQQRGIKGLLEFSLFNRDGVVTQSSEASAKGRSLPPELKDRFLNDHHEWIDSNGERIQIYRPQVVSADCVRCHTSWNPGELGGVTYFSFSTAELAQTEKNAAASIGDARIELSRNAIGSIVAMAVVLALSVFASVRWLIGRPLGLFAGQMANFERGDLTQRVDYQSKDEIGTLSRLFDASVSKLERAIGEAQSSANASGSSASSQAASIEETSAAMHQISTAVQQNAESAQQANELMSAANSNIVAANASIRVVSTSMDEVAEASRRIEQILRVIGEIATNTNMLAINAAIEAARAGKAGEGFAVVAENVRKLASQTTAATSDVATIIEEAKSKILNGTQRVRDTRDAFEKIAAQSQKATKLLQQIAAMSKEQAQGVVQVSQTLKHLETSTQQSAAQADHLMTAMSTFKTK